MAAELSFLIPGFRQLLNTLIEECWERSVRIEVFSTLVTPVEQAGLWRQGRSPGEVEMKALALENAKAFFLADCLRQGVALATNKVTEELPGYSWQQWGEAAQVVWVDSNNKLVWSKDWLDKPARHNGYAVLHEEADRLGLAVSKPHTLIRLRREEAANEVYDIRQINQEMQLRFGK